MRVTIEGTVQGVGFRPTVHRIATSLGLNGTVWNDGSKVMIDVDNADALVERIEKELPPLARIDSIVIENIKTPRYEGFSISPSDHRSGGVSIPTDTAVCDDCLKEMRSEGRRKGYAFTTCTNCGARFTLLRSLPYDRNNTAMAEFPMCHSCAKEYKDPNDRRFHHQTICCPECGPRYYLLGKDGKEIESDPIDTFAKIVSSGKIGIAKSWGGMHICSVIENVVGLRKWYGREQKPFAIMVRDIDTAKRYVTLTKKEEELLTSPNRPIVLADKADEDLCQGLAPGLNNIGIFLPYTGMQHLLFDRLDRDALIMTSANLPGEPMILDDRDVLELGADAYLLHNQNIVNRADDSVVRAYKNNTQFIRKSRGFIPSFINIGSKHCAVGIGAQENLTATVASNGRLHTTQHIGNGESLGVVEYLQSATDSLIGMLNCTPEVIAMDLHPGYINRKYGKTLSERYSAPIVEVQHHWTHTASLIAEHEIDEGLFLSVDGTGYCPDGNAWGGEVLKADLKEYERVAHLEYIPLIGSEKALYDLRRLKFAIDCINGVDTHIIEENTAEVMRKVMKNSISSSSLGRFLDALSYTLGICERRTYDGEPAMKTEPYLAKGKLIEGFETELKNGVVMTAHLFRDIPKDASKADIAYSMTRSVIDCMVNAACDSAMKHGIDTVGLTGGVSYNGPICSMAEESVKSRGLRFITHDRVPSGDGGISVGQTAIALRSLE